MDVQTGDGAHSLCKRTIGVTFALSLLLDPDPGGAVSVLGSFFFFYCSVAFHSFLSKLILFY